MRYYKMNGFNPAPDLVAQIMIDNIVRREVARNSHVWFFAMYFSHYITYKTAPFQQEMFDLTQNDDNRMLCVVSFRGSGKSTIFSLSYPIWAVIGVLQKKFVLLLSQTMEQAKQQMKNIRDELEENKLLRRDLGPFKEETDGWRSSSLIIPKYNARIMVASSEQSIRGIKHNQYRPDLIILDDVEDLQSSKTRESRDKTYNWVTGDVIPLGDKNTKRVIIGNLLHEDSLLMRMKKNIQNGNINGVFREYPLLDVENNILWPGKYPDMDSVEQESKTIGDRVAWLREYLLKIVYDQGYVIQPEWIKYYDEMPPLLPRDNKFRFVGIGIDPAISEKDSADKTAIVMGNVFGDENNRKIYILPEIYNKRMNFPDTIDVLQMIVDKLTADKLDNLIFSEEVGYQTALSQQLKHIGYNVEGYKPGHSDKLLRLNTLGAKIRNGDILFPRKGAEELIQQLVHFGTDRFDDLTDAFTSLVHSCFTTTHRGKGKIEPIRIRRGEYHNPCAALEIRGSNNHWGTTYQLPSNLV